MNRYRMRFAPKVWTPKLSPMLVRWLRGLRQRGQRRDVCIHDIEVSGQANVQQALERGDGLMIMPNHSSHADPYVIYGAADRIGTPLYVMATWHVFHDKPLLVQHILRWHGCFSVDREANDIGAFRLATGILQERSEPLVIFPEGEIYHCNDKVTPFRDGAAAIAVAAARKAKRPIHCVPCAIKYRYKEDPSEALIETMGRLEEAILWRRKSEMPLEQRIYRFAEALLAVKELEYFQETKPGLLPERIRDFGEHLLGQVERRHDLKESPCSVPERVKAARRLLIEKLGDDQISEQQSESHWRDLEDLFLVVQSFSYPGDYVIGKPSIERMAETLDKFEEDVLHLATATIKGPRDVSVQFGQPITVPGERKIKGLTADLSANVEQSVQSMLDEL